MKLGLTINFYGRGNLLGEIILDGDLNEGKIVVIEIPKIMIIAGSNDSLKMTERFLL